MLLITDRMDGSPRVRDALRPLQPVHTLALIEARRRTPTHLFIVCHVDLASAEARQALAAALRHHRTHPRIPVLAVVPDPADPMLGDADMPAFDAAVAEGSDDAALQDAVRRCRARARGDGGETQVVPTAVPAAVKVAERSMARMFEAIGLQRRMPTTDLATGADALLAMARQSKIQEWIAMVKRYDDATYQHCLLVAGLVAGFAVHLGLTADNQQVLAQAALLHDIGKARIPRDVLNKSGPLTESERTLVETHCAVGHAFLVRQGNIDPAILDVVRHHHEMLDGSGYPDRLSHFRISDSVRTVTICDIYAALIERRPYRSPMPPAAALDVMRDMGAKIDGRLLARFAALVAP